MDADTGVRTITINSLHNVRDALTAEHLQPYAVGLARGLACSDDAGKTSKGKDKDKKPAACGGSAKDEARRTKAAELLALLTGNTIGMRTLNNMSTSKINLEAVLKEGISDVAATLLGKVIAEMLEERTRAVAAEAKMRSNVRLVKLTDVENDEQSTQFVAGTSGKRRKTGAQTLAEECAEMKTELEDAHQLQNQQTVFIRIEQDKIDALKQLARNAGVDSAQIEEVLAQADRGGVGCDHK